MQLWQASLKLVCCSGFPCCPEPNQHCCNSQQHWPDPQFTQWWCTRGFQQSCCDSAQHSANSLAYCFLDCAGTARDFAGLCCVRHPRCPAVGPDIAPRMDGHPAAHEHFSPHHHLCRQQCRLQVLAAYLTISGCSTGYAHHHSSPAAPSFPQEWLDLTVHRHCQSILGAVLRLGGQCSHRTCQAPFDNVLHLSAVVQHPGHC